MKNAILILGSNGLIGSSITKNLKEDKLVLSVDRNGNENFLNCDLSKKKSYDQIFKKIKKAKITIDFVINCTYPKFKKKNLNPLKINEKIFLENINLHLKLNLFVYQKFINYFLKNKIKGGIVTFGSIYGSMIPRFEIYDKKIITPIEYNFIKSSIIHMNKYFAKYVLGSGIRLNTISPGGVFDNQNKSFVKKYSAHCNNNKMLNSEDINGIINFLISENSQKITGQNIIIDDGFTL